MYDDPVPVLCLLIADRLCGGRRNADCDNSLTILDATAIQRKIADYITLYTGEQIWKKISA